MVSQAKRLTIDALLLSAALILSYIESLIPILLPIPGLKLGLANLIVMYTFHRVSRIDGAVISVLRVVLISILFGSVTSFSFSLTGAVLSYLMLILSAPLCNREYISFIGVSVLCSTAHNTGQILAAIIMFSSTAIVSYLPWLLLLAIPTGMFTGFIMNILDMYYYKKEKLYDK